MPKPITTFCTASRSHLTFKPKNSHVWVSEDVLSETFAAFVQNHKRFGSNVPGPLEARRRASKRKATHLAHQSATNYNPESFGLFETKSQQGWWQKTETPPEHQKRSWDWLLSLPQVIMGPPPPPPVSLECEHEPDKPKSTLGKVNIKEVEKQLRKHLHEIRTHTAAMDMLADLSISLKRAPKLAALILQHMIAEQWHDGEIAEFLLDPRSNTAGTANHLYVLEHAQEHVELFTSLLHQYIFKAARLGLLDVSEIQKILLFVLKIDVSLFPTRSTWADICIQLMNAMDESKVLIVHDLGKDFIHRWLDEISSHSFCPSVPELLWRLQKATGSSDEHALESVVYTSISMVKEDTICHLKDLVEFLLSRQSYHLGSLMFSLTERLCKEAGPDTPEMLHTTPLQQRVDWSFRRNLLRKVGGPRSDKVFKFDEDAEVDLEVPSTSKSMVVQVLRQQRLDQVSKLELWYAVLGNLGLTPIDQLGINRNTLCRFLDVSLDRGDAQQRSLAVMWVSMALTVHDDNLHRSSGMLKNLEYELRRRTFMAFTETGREHPLANICRALQVSPLPAKNKLLQRINALSGGSVVVKQNYWALIKKLNMIDSARILLLRNDLVYRSIGHHFPDKLREVAECLNTDMAKFEKTCIDIIRDVKGSTNIVFRLLHKNEELRRALKKTWSRTHVNRDSGTALQQALGGYSYTQLVEMIHNFAYEMSRTKQLSPRNALRRVYRIRGYLFACGGARQLSLLESLWHAGVTRFDQERGGSCYHNVRWLYDMILREFGEHEANRILHASGKADIPDLRSGPRTCQKELWHDTDPRESSEEGGLLSRLEVSQRLSISDADVSSPVVCESDTDTGSGTGVHYLPFTDLPTSNPPTSRADDASLTRIQNETPSQARTQTKTSTPTRPPPPQKTKKQNKIKKVQKNKGQKEQSDNCGDLLEAALVK